MIYLVNRRQIFFFDFIDQLRRHLSLVYRIKVQEHDLRSHTIDHTAILLEHTLRIQSELIMIRSVSIQWQFTTSLVVDDHPVTSLLVQPIDDTSKLDIRLQIKMYHLLRRDRDAILRSVLIEFVQILLQICHPSTMIVLRCRTSTRRHRQFLSLQFSQLRAPLRIKMRLQLLHRHCIQHTQSLMQILQTPMDQFTQYQFS